MRAFFVRLCKESLSFLPLVVWYDNVEPVAATIRGFDVDAIKPAVQVGAKP